MKRLTTILSVAVAIALCACAGNKSQQDSQQSNTENMEKKTTLVAYFSATGTTKAAAEKLAQAVDADLHEIQPEQPYTDADLDWRNQQSRSSVEMKDKSSRPAIKNKVENMDQYTTVYIGYPIWWYIAPTIINTFVEQYNLEGKTVIPFFTSGGSGAGETMKYLTPSAPKANWKEPINLTGKSKGEIEKLVK
ncbi:MAG: NAD(P)H-dependent oxidoreductase [Muribaculaceae bacterium]|nr:NAD(P)H-dependent oxidoreductase [Muribaculaceae bacterium]